MGTLLLSHAWNMCKNVANDGSDTMGTVLLSHVEKASNNADFCCVRKSFDDTKSAKIQKKRPPATRSVPLSRHAPARSLMTNCGICDNL